MSADTPGYALTRRAVLGATIVELGAALIPKLITSTGANGGIAVIAGSVRKRASRRGFPFGRWAVEDALRGNRVWLCEPRHGCQQLGIPRREHASSVLGHCCAGPMRRAAMALAARWTISGDAEHVPRMLRAGDEGNRFLRGRAPGFIVRCLTIDPYRGHAGVVLSGSREVWVGKEREQTLLACQRSALDELHRHNGNGANPCSLQSYRRLLIGWQTLEYGDDGCASLHSAQPCAHELNLQHQIAEIVTRLPASDEQHTRSLRHAAEGDRTGTIAMFFRKGSSPGAAAVHSRDK